MPADVKDIDEKYVYPKNLVVKAEAELAYMLYRQDFKVHLVFTKALVAGNFNVNQFTSNSGAKPTKLAIKINTIDLEFAADLSTLKYEGDGAVNFEHPMSWKLEDKGYDFYEKGHAAYINDYRVNGSLPALRFSRYLSEIARMKAIDFGFNAYMAHNSKVYGAPSSMQKFFNYYDGLTASTGENIHCSAYKACLNPAQAFEDFRRSTDHHRQMISRDVATIGVGFSYIGGRCCYV